MAGVAGPMLRRSRWQGARFLLALTVGRVAAGLVLAVPVYLLGHLVQRHVPVPARLLTVAALAVVFGMADLLDRTPQLRRQVPQALVRQLPAGPLGLVWGFDLGLLFTTRKTVSLLWLAIGAVGLLYPSTAGWVLVTFALAASLLVSIWSTLPAVAWIGGRWQQVWVRRIRTASGSAMLIVATGTALTVLLA